MVNNQIEPSVFEERQFPRMSSFIPHLLVYPSFWLVLAPINADFGVLLGFAATLVSVGIRLIVSKKIRVTQTNLEVGKAAIPRVILGIATVIEPTNQFAEKGPNLNSKAFVALKGLNGLVKVLNVDPVDPTPYLLISTRRPHELAKALTD